MQLFDFIPYIYRVCHKLFNPIELELELLLDQHRRRIAPAQLARCGWVFDTPDLTITTELHTCIYNLHFTWLNV
jgi:hypothetical protein